MSERVQWRQSWGAPRLLTRGQVRAYLQIDDAELVRRMRHGQVPRPLWGSDPGLQNARWDRSNIDKALDRASTITANDVLATKEMDEAFGFNR